MTLPWFYAHWVLIGSLSRVLLAELFSTGSPGHIYIIYNIYNIDNIYNIYPIYNI